MNNSSSSSSSSSNEPETDLTHILPTDTSAIRALRYALKSSIHARSTIRSRHNPAIVQAREQAIQDYEDAITQLILLRSANPLTTTPTASTATCDNCWPSQPCFGHKFVHPSYRPRPTGDPFRCHAYGCTQPRAYGRAYCAGHTSSAP